MLAVQRRYSPDSCRLWLGRQAAALDGSALDALALQQDGLVPAEIDISQGQVVQAFMVALVFIVLDECLDIGLKRTR